MLPTKKNQSWFPSIFNDFIGSDWVERLHSSSPMNIMENENEFKVEMAVPGLTKDDFSVKVTNDNLLSVCVKQEKKSEDKDKKGRYLRKEFSYTQFQQNLILPDNVDKDKIEAKVDNGVLDIIIPKVTPDKVAPVEKQIEVH
ncbi:MAG: Hsp20/alpha crystallin family protein [Bacteroidales bacterium]|nr:Hsp20/alpha crystallin family protein [Bacteroidales bacterium]